MANFEGLDFLNTSQVLRGCHFDDSVFISLAHHTVQLRSRLPEQDHQKGMPTHHARVAGAALCRNLGFSRGTCWSRVEDCAATKPGLI